MTALHKMSSISKPPVIKRTCWEVCKYCDFMAFTPFRICVNKYSEHFQHVFTQEHLECESVDYKRK